MTTRSIDGLLYESAGGRVYVEVLRGVRVQAGYSRDKTKAPGSRLWAGTASQRDKAWSPTPKAWSL